MNPITPEEEQGYEQYVERCQYARVMPDEFGAWLEKRRKNAKD